MLLLPRSPRAGLHVGDHEISCLPATTPNNGMLIVVAARAYYKQAVEGLAEQEKQRSIL